MSGSAGCSHDWDALEPQASTSQATSTSSSTGGGAGGMGGSSSTTTTSTSTTSSSSTAGGAGGTGGMGQGGEGQGGLGTGDCPTGLAGPPLVRVAVDATSAYCVDATEVSNLQYDAWLGSNPSTANQPAYCSSNGAFAPPGWPPDASKKDEPVVGIDYCDAWSYCAAQGKHLCGAPGGGATNPAQVADPTASEWLFACTNGGLQTFPYGDVYVPLNCNGKDFTFPDKLVDTGSAPNCQGGFSGIYDLSGNAWEWDASCDAYTGSSDTCRVRGGGFDSPEQALSCSATATLARSGAGFNVGFRCCAHALP